MTLPSKYFGIQKIDEYDYSINRTVKDVYAQATILQLEGLMTHLILNSAVDSQLRQLFGEIFKNVKIKTLRTSVFDGRDFNEESITMCQYDVEFLSKYGNRSISNLVKTSFELGDFSEFHNMKAVNVDYDTILKSKYYEKWSRLFSIYNENYDVIRPYNISLDESTTDTMETKKDISRSNSTDGTYGFDSENSVPESKRESESTNEYKRENPRTRTYTRVGNTGNISYSELVEKEREKLQFILMDEIYSDIASVIGRGTYK